MQSKQGLKKEENNYEFDRKYLTDYTSYADGRGPAACQQLPTSLCPDVTRELLGLNSWTQILCQYTVTSTACTATTPVTYSQIPKIENNFYFCPRELFLYGEATQQVACPGSPSMLLQL